MPRLACRLPKGGVLLHEQLQVCKISHLLSHWGLSLSLDSLGNSKLAGLWGVAKHTYILLYPPVNPYILIEINQQREVAILFFSPFLASL